MAKKKTAEAVIKVQDLTKTFVIGERQERKLFVLRGVNLQIQRGEILAIVGASGAGKSTLLHIVGTLDRPTSGKVFFDETDVFAMNDDQVSKFRNQQIGFVFQFHHLLPEFTAFENVAMPALILGKSISQARDKAKELLAQVGLQDKSESKPTQLSGGEQQRVAVARALMNSPRVILADEPSGNLDTESAHQLHELIWKLSRDYDQTFAVVTHNEALAKSADRIVRIQDGVIQTTSR
ncbi:MAG TPA: lipoprotein-releasing system ATP-binding protein LolD [Bacteroidetes bacterium]|nr:lipoprotein-releasing system ATP-binding protein LolD [Bacteroidota bacterium]